MFWIIQKNMWKDRSVLRLTESFKMLTLLEPSKKTCDVYLYSEEQLKEQLLLKGQRHDPSLKIQTIKPYLSVLAI